MCSPSRQPGERVPSSWPSAVLNEGSNPTPPELIEAAAFALFLADCDDKSIPFSAVEGSANQPFGRTDLNPIYPTVRHRVRHTRSSDPNPSRTVSGMTIDSHSVARARSLPSCQTDSALGSPQPSICRWLHCDQVFPTASALGEHINDVHVGRRQNEHWCLWQGCPRADHIFHHRDKIILHVRLHSKERPFCCDHPKCGRTFARSDSLEAHRKVHAAIGRAYACRWPGCRHSYFHAKSRRKHERSVHGIGDV